MSVSRLMQMAAAGAGNHPAPLPIGIEDYFSTYLYTGNGSTQTITNGIDLAGEGGMVWVKERTGTSGNVIFDTERGATKRLISYSTNAESTAAFDVTAFNSDGFSVGDSIQVNGPNRTYASWTFRKAPRFFDVVTYTGDGVAGREIAHGLGTDVGSIFVKKTSAAENWIVFHNDLGASQDGNGFIRLNTTGAGDNRGFLFWGDGSTYTAPTSTVFTLSSNADVNESGATYVAYLFAHDPLGPSGDGSDGLIACGSFTVSGTASVDLGWEPQWLLVKQVDSTGSWNIVDSMRGFNMEADSILYPNSSSEELSGDLYDPTPTGFNVVGLGSGTYIYIAIRRGPMRQPTSGTEVFTPYAPSSDTEVPYWSATFPVVDFALGRWNTASAGNILAFDRLRGSGVGLETNTTDSESGAASDPNNYISNIKLDYMYGFNQDLGFSASSEDFAWMFRRAPGFFDVVAYTGDGTAGRTVSHNLGVAPEMIIQKARSTTFDWHVLVPFMPSGQRIPRLNEASGSSGSVYEPLFFGDGSAYIPPTSSGFTVSSASQVNGSGNTYIAYLFATLPGVSKVGSYTGNGTSQTIDCGFTSGARFVLIKRTDSTGDWYVWDTARGIVTGNDPFLELNTTDAEVTSDDSIDPDATGFIVNQTATTNVNVNAASYIFLAIA